MALAYWRVKFVLFVSYLNHKLYDICTFGGRTEGYHTSGWVGTASHSTCLKFGLVCFRGYNTLLNCSGFSAEKW